MPCEQVLLFPSAEPPCSLIFSRTRPACAHTRIHAHAHAHTPLRDVSLPRCIEGASGPVCASRQPLPLSAAPQSPGPHSPTSLILGGVSWDVGASHALPPGSAPPAPSGPQETGSVHARAGSYCPIPGPGRPFGFRFRCWNNSYVSCLKTWLFSQVRKPRAV